MGYRHNGAAGHHLALEDGWSLLLNSPRARAAIYPAVSDTRPERYPRDIRTLTDDGSTPTTTRAYCPRELSTAAAGVMVSGKDDDASNP